MRDQELVNALRTHLDAARKIGLYPGKSGIWAVIEQAADRIANQNTHILALQKEIEGLRAQNEQLRKLTEFRRACPNSWYCESCAMYWENNGTCGNESLYIKRPPQSWCYVEAMKDE